MLRNVKFACSTIFPPCNNPQARVNSINKERERKKNICTGHGMSATGNILTSATRQSRRRTMKQLRQYKQHSSLNTFVTKT